MTTPTKEQQYDLHISYWNGFYDALELLQVPDCPYCGTKMKQGYACGESFIVPVGFRDGNGCEKCRKVPMHGNLKQVLEDWEKIRNSPKYGKILGEQKMNDRCPATNELLTFEYCKNCWYQNRWTCMFPYFRMEDK